MQYHSKQSPEKLCPNAEIRRTRSTINTYGSETLRPKGQVTLCCERRGRIHTIDFLVVNVPDGKQALLSGRDAQALNYLKVYADETRRNSAQSGASPTTRKADEGRCITVLRERIQARAWKSSRNPHAQRTGSQCQTSTRPIASRPRGEAGQSK